MSVLGFQLVAPVSTPAEAEASDSNLELLRALDPDAFSDFVKEHQDRVFDFCLRMMGEREEALELSQEIFVSVHQSLPNFRSDSKVSTWLYRICKNHCLNRLKYLERRGRGRSDELDEVSDAALFESGIAPPRPDEALEAERDRQMVQGAISQLEPDQRALVALRDIEGLSYEEIVEITDLPLGTVKSRLHRAREKLAALLSGQGP